MAYEIRDKEIIETLDINYVIDFYKKQGENCIRILHGRQFQPHGDKDYKLTDTIIIEPIEDKDKYVYQDGHRTFSIERTDRGVIINPYFDKSGVYDVEHSLSKKFYNYILDYKLEIRDKKIKSLIK